MNKMRAIEVKAPSADFELVYREIPTPCKNQIRIKVEACGVCHGESRIKNGILTKPTDYPRISGHEVVGIIDEIGEGVVSFNIGDKVGVGWFGGYCLKCEACKKGDFQNCQDKLITGLSIDGGYAEYMIANIEAVVKIPDELSPLDAAPLLCAGRTTFSALTESVAKPGDIVAIQGIGGLGHLGIQFAKKLGFKVIALSRGENKKELSLKLGASLYIDTEKGDATKKLQELGGAKVILITAPNSKAASDLIPGLSFGGQMVIVAAPNESMSVHPGMLFRRNLSIKGWVGGNLPDTLNFSVITNIIPMIEVFPLEEASKAYKKMIDSKVKFRCVLKMDL